MEQPIRLYFATRTPRSAEEVVEVLRAAAGPLFEFTCGPHAGADAADANAILIDFVEPAAESFNALRRLTKRYPELPVIAVVSAADQNLALEALKEGALTYLIREQLAGRNLQPIIRHVAVFRAAMRETRRSSAILKALGIVAETFLQGGDPEATIVEALGHVGRAADACRVHILRLYEPQDGEPLASPHHEWCAPGIPPCTGDADARELARHGSGFTEWLDALRREEVCRIVVRHAAPALQAVLGPRGIKSQIRVPLHVDSQLWGFIGLDDCVTERRWFSAEVDALHAVAGIVAGYIRRIRSEENLRESEEKYAHLLELSPDAVIIVREDAHVIAGRAFTELFGYTQDDVADLTDIVREEDLDMILKRREARLRGEPVPQTLRIDLKAKDGSLVPCETSSTLIRYGGRPAVMVLIRDVTAREESERELAEHRAHLEDLVRERTAELEAANRELQREAAEHRRAEEALRASERGYRLLAENVDDIIFTLDMQFRFTYVSPSVTEMLGYRLEDALQTELVDLLTPASLERAMGEFHRALADWEADPAKGGPSRNFQVELRRRDGFTLWTEVTANLLRGPDGAPAGVVGIARDITARREAAEGLRASEEKFRTLAEQGLVGVGIQRGNRIAYVNQAAADILGVTVGEMLQWGFEDRVNRIHPDDRAMVRRLITQRLWARSGGAVLPPFRVVTPAGEVRWVQQYIKSIRYEGKPAIFSAALNITQRMEAEQALRVSEERYRILFESAPEAICVMDREGTFLLLNTTAARQLGGSPEQLAGKNMVDAFPPGIAENQIKDLREVIDSETGRVTEDETFIQGRPRWYRTSVQPLRDAEGRVYAALVIARDISDSKKAQDERLAYEEQLRTLTSETANAEERVRRRIASTLHDSIGQALALARIRLGALGAGDCGPEMQEQIGRIRDLIAETIAATRSLTFELSPPVLYDLGLEAAVEWLAERVQAEHGIHVEVRCKWHAGARVGDARAPVFNSIRELLHNVAKHAGSAEAQVSIDADEEELRVCVRDDGVGFDASRLRPGAHGMSGFGLFNIRERFNHLGGRVEIDSRPGAGTAVHLAVPLRSPQGRPAREA